MKGVFSSERSDWLTPQWILENVRDIFNGQIDLDPCSDDQNNSGAKTVYTIEDDGLSKPWRGRVFMNPPYSRDKEILRAWSRKWKEEFDNRHMIAGIALVAARTDTDWWLNLYKTADMVCFLFKRVHFGLPGKEDSTPSTFPSAVIFATNDPLHYHLNTFAAAFKSHGNLWVKARVTASGTITVGDKLYCDR